ncbi:hypothetical protein KBZ21_40700, partial [Streptomyces sp. A73]|nr:hypothetical protein [Streptomyces sp. A73]
CILNASLELTPEESGIDPNLWPAGLLLLWEWHPGREDGEAARSLKDTFLSPALDTPTWTKETPAA